MLDTAAGSPLALAELATDLLASGEADALGGGGRPINSVLERALVWRARTLPADAQRLLLLAAADDSGDLGLLLAAARSMEIDAGALGRVEQAQLLDLDAGRFQFRHPLVRSAVYQAAALAQALECLAYCQVIVSPARAESDATEGLRVACETGQDRFVASHLTTLAIVAAIRGDDVRCRQLVDEAVRLADGKGLAFLSARAELALAMLALGCGRPDEALDRYGALMPAGPGTGHPGVVLFVVPDLVEAAVRAGRLDQALPMLDRFAGWVEASGAAWSRAALARCRALLADDDDADAWYEAALAHHGTIAGTFDAARTSLVYGEHLRRQRRRVDARPHLRAALGYFERLGAEPWSARARAELRATGETARRREVDTRQDLTPQELQIARSVAVGATNRDVAAQLFISSRTVDYHLRKVFTKLDISSRHELRDVDLGS